MNQILAWKNNAERLAAWVSEHMVNRDDAFGKYFLKDGSTANCKVDGPVDRDLLIDHFSSRQIIGLYTTSKDDRCRWLTIDIDRHDGSSDEVATNNERFALHLHEILVELGFQPLLFDSNGKGGRHLTVLFDEQVPARDVRAFGLWLVREWCDFGLSGRPEVFPKQDTINKNGNVGYGNFVRLFGKHHKRDHFSKIWDGQDWIEGETAIKAILDTTGDPLRLVPAAALSFHEAKPERRAWWKKYDGDLKKLDLRRLFESRGLWVRNNGEGYLVQCPWHEEHTTGDDSAGLLAARPNVGLFPAFHCFHDHCDGRTIEDVLEFFGKDVVKRFCEKKRSVETGNAIGTARAYHESRGDNLISHKGDWWHWDSGRYVLIPEIDVRAYLWKWLESRGNVSKATVSGVIDALKAVANLPATKEMPCWIGAGGAARPEDVVAFKNGLLDLGEYAATGRPKLMPHTQNWFSDNCLTHKFDPGASCPAWMKFLAEVFEDDGERIRALAQWFGYCLTNDIRQHKFAMLIGPPRSGKGTVMQVLNAMLGPQNVANPTLTSLGSRFGLAPLVGKLAALVGDGHLGKQSDAVAILERLKSITGGDPQNVDRKNSAELANVAIKARFTIAVNELPRLPDASAALISRMLVFKFGLSFAGREDFDLGDRLLAEIPGVTNWALQGLLDLRQDGRLDQPREGKVDLDEFSRLSSPVKAFLEDCCEFGPDHTITTEDLRRAWQKWCNQHGHEPGSETFFGTKLRAADSRVRKTRRREGGKQVYVYGGLRQAE